MLDMINNSEQFIQNKQNANTFFVKYDDKYYPLKLSEINWISASGNYCTLHTDTHQEFILRISLTKIKRYLLTGTFVQINKKNIINTCKIKMYDPLGSVTIHTQEFSVSRRFKKILEDNLQFLP